MQQHSLLFHQGAKATEKLKQIQKQLKVAKHKLIQSVETRWNSVFYMLEGLHEQREAVTTANCLLGKSSLCLNDEEFTMIHLTVETLRPFEEVSREVSAEKYVSMSKITPLHHYLEQLQPLSIMVLIALFQQSKHCKLDADSVGFKPTTVLLQELSWISGLKT